MTSFGGAVRKLQPAIEPVFSAVQQGLDVASEDHVIRRYLRTDDQGFFAHGARRQAIEVLRAGGWIVEKEDSRPALGMSGLLLFFDGLYVRLLRSKLDDAGNMIVPVPGRSRARQRYWSQEQAVPLPNMETDNLLLLWTDNDGKLSDPMTLVRPVGGDHRRQNLRLDWSSRLFRDMARLREEDLVGLMPDQQFPQLGEEAG